MAIVNDGNSGSDCFAQRDRERTQKSQEGLKRHKNCNDPALSLLFVVVFVPFVYVPDPVGQSSLTPNYFCSRIRSASRASLKFGLYRNAVSIWRFASSTRFIFARATP